MKPTLLLLLLLVFVACSEQAPTPTATPPPSPSKAVELKMDPASPSGDFRPDAAADEPRRSGEARASLVRKPRQGCLVIDGRNAAGM